MRFQPPYHVEGHGLPEDADEIDIAEDLERIANGEMDWGRGYYVLDATDLVICDVPFRIPQGLGTALLLQDEAEALANKICRLLNADVPASV